MYKMIIVLMCLCSVAHANRPKQVVIMEPNQDPAWKYQIKRINNEIEKLKDNIKMYRMNALQATEMSLTHLIDNWDRYTKLVEEGDDFERKAKNLEGQVTQLERQKKMIEDQHQDEY